MAFKNVLFSALGNRCRVFLSELTYDDNGKVTSVTAPDHTESFVYDDKDLLTSKTVDGTTYEFAYKSTADNYSL